LPILQPAVLSAAILAFVISFGNISASIFLGGAGMSTLPVAIFTAAEHGYDVAITAVSVIVIVVSLVVVGTIERVTGLERIL
jgi:putative spermidine/putrescine transport system permease protein